MNVIRKLQSRIAQRANLLTEKHGWATYYKAQHQSESLQAARKEIAALANDQVLDKKLYSAMTHAYYSWG